MNIGKAIKFYRTQCGLSQRELAGAADLSISYLSLLERNKRDPVFSTLQAIAKALNVSLIVLVFFASDNEEVHQLPVDVREKLSYVALQLSNVERSAQ